MYAIDNKDKTKVIVCDEIPDGYSEIYEEDYLKIAGEASDISNAGIDNFDIKGYSGVNAEPSFSLDAKTGTVLGDVVQARTTMLAPTATQTDGLYVVNLTYLNTRLKDYATLAYVNAELAKKADASALGNYVTKVSADATYQAKLGYTPVQTGTGIDQLTNIVKIGWGNQTKYPGRIRVTVDTTDRGNIVTDAYLNHGTLPANFATLICGVTVEAAKYGNGRIYGNIIHTNYIRGLTADSSGILFNNTAGRPILEFNVSPIATLLDLTNNKGKVGAITAQTKFGNTYIMGYSDPSSGIGYIRVKAPTMGSSYDVTETLNPSMLAISLGINPPAGKIVIDDNGSFCGALSSGADPICTWVAATKSQPTFTTWSMQAYCSRGDTARQIAFTWSILYTF